MINKIIMNINITRVIHAIHVTWQYYASWSTQLPEKRAKGFKNELSKVQLECMIAVPREHSSKSSEFLAITENGSG